MYKDDDIERMFNQEVRDKKRTATGVYHRASRRGYVGSVRTHVDYLKGKAKKEYIKAGEIKVTNMYDVIENVPSLKELEEMDFKTAKGIITVAKSKFKNKELAKHWETTLYSLYNKVYKKYELFNGNYGGLGKNVKKDDEKNTDKIKTNKKGRKASEPVQVELLPEVIKSPATDEPKAVEQVKVADYNFTGFEIKFGGLHTGKQIADRLMNYISTLEEGSKYKLNFKVEEIENK